MQISCSNISETKENTENTSSSSPTHPNMSNKKESITLIMEFGDENSQIIQCSDTLLTYGIGHVRATNVMSRNDIAWNLSHPIKKKRLSVSQQKVVQTAISKLASVNYIDPNVAKDDVEFILYINNYKVASGYSVFIESFPKDIQKIINELLLMASPLYYKDSKS